MKTIQIQKDSFEIDPSDVAERIAPYEDVSRGIQKSRPKSETGLVQYVWRMARFHSGEDTHMPVTCEFWLRSWLEEEGVLKDDLPSRLRMKIVSEATEEIEPLVTSVLEEFGLDSTKAAKRWKRAGLF